MALSTMRGDTSTVSLRLPVRHSAGIPGVEGAGVEAIEAKSLKYVSVLIRKLSRKFVASGRSLNGPYVRSVTPVEIVLHC